MNRPPKSRRRITRDYESELSQICFITTILTTFRLQRFCGWCGVIFEFFRFARAAFSFLLVARRHLIRRHLFHSLESPFPLRLQPGIVYRNPAIRAVYRRIIPKVRFQLPKAGSEMRREWIEQNEKLHRRNGAFRRW